MKEPNMNLEQLLKEVLREEGEKVKLPPAEDVWREIAQGLSSRTTLDRKRNLRRRIIAAAVILAVSAGGFSAVFPQKVTAIGKKVMRIVTSFTQDTVTINTTLQEKSDTKSGQPAPPPPEDNYSQPIRPQIVSLEEARKLSPFPFRTPQYLPDGFQLKQVKIVKSEVTAIITLEYGRQNSELFICQENILGEMTASDNVRAGEAELREIDILGNKGTMIIFNNGLINVSFLADGIKYQINGYFKQDVLLKVAQSLIE
jgi:hypothetical protein